jgi:N-acetylmuramoyl-L-alanine amidase
MKRLPFLAFLIGCFLLFPIATQAAELGHLRQITALRWYSHNNNINAPAKLRLVIDEAGPVTYNTFVLTNPTRLVLDLNGAWVHTSMPKVYTVDDDMVRQVRISQNQPNTVRIVLEVKEGMQADEFRIFPLKEDTETGKPWRLVLDFGQLKPLAEDSSDPAKPQPVPSGDITVPVISGGQVGKAPPLPEPLPLQPFPNPKPIKFFDEPGLENKIIVLDPGHGGSDPGAVGYNRTMEKNATLAISQEVRRLLEKQGAIVVMTRTTDQDVYGPNATAPQELKARVDVAKKAKANLFVSIHINSFSNREADGTATYYYPKTTGDVRLASFIQDGLVNQISLKDRGEYPARFYVLKNLVMPAALVEVAFISNPNEEKLLNDPKFIKKAAAGIADGIAKYFTPAE